LEFDTAEGWTAQPGWLGNAAERPIVEAVDGTVHFRVTEPGRGMKWRLDVAGIDPTMAPYLLLRYRARNVVGGYALWLFDAGPGREAVGWTQLTQDGEWHVVALDWEALDQQEVITALATEVQAGEGGPAEVWLDDLRPAEETPAGALVWPPSPQEPQAWREEFDNAEGWQAQPDWLSNDANEFALTAQDGLLTLAVQGKGRGMKWSKLLAEGPNLNELRYCTVRYRANGVEPYGDYFLWLGSEAGGQPQQSVTVWSLAQVQSDGQWHLETIRLDERFVVREMALQVQAHEEPATIELDFLEFSDRRPRLDLRDVLEYEAGWERARLPDGQFTPVDLAPLANAKSRLKLRTLHLKSWFEAHQVCVAGVPFALVADETDLLATPLAEVEPVGVPLGRAATELYLLLAAPLPEVEYSGLLGPSPFNRFSNPERFVVQVAYADGLVDEFFPVRVRSEQYEVVRGLDAYRVGPLREVAIEEVRLLEKMHNASLLLAGLTASRAPAAAPPLVLRLPRVAGSTRPRLPEALQSDGDPKLERRDVGFALENRFLGVAFQTKPGLRLLALDCKYLPARQTALEPGDLFTLKIGDKTFPSGAFRVGSVWERRQENECQVTVLLRGPARLPVRGELRVALGLGPELRLSLSLRNTGDAPLRGVLTFPLLTHLRLSEDLSDTWYLFARQGAIIHHAPTVQQAAYSGAHPLQITDVFNGREGGGLYLLGHDLEDTYRWFGLEKDEAGVSLRVDYLEEEVAPGGTFQAVETVLGAHPGDWREAVEAYQAWTRTWYKPVVPRKDWFRGIFNYRQHNLRGGLYDWTAKRYTFQPMIDLDRDKFGCLDYLHIFDWGASERYGRVGDYSHYDEIGGREALREAIAGAQAQGIPVGLYLEGYLVDERGVWGREHVERGHLIRPDGQPLLWADASTEHMMCPAVTEWQDYLAETCARVARELQPNGLYIDQHGFANLGKACYSPDHGHPVPAAPLRGERDMMRKIRAAVPPEIALLTEETPVDFNAQLHDGGLGYSVCWTNTALAPHRLDLFRFCFPDFKIFQLVAYNNFLNGGWEKLKFPFFNGEATWLGNHAEGGFDAESRAFLRKAFAILNAHEDAFLTLHPEPLVPTEQPEVFANAFPGEKETVWTLFNGDYRTVRGDLLRVRHVPGATYRDLWHDTPLEPRFEDGKAVIALTMGPQEVGCVAQVRGAGGG